MNLPVVAIVPEESPSIYVEISKSLVVSLIVKEPAVPTFSLAPVSKLIPVTATAEVISGTLVTFLIMIFFASAGGLPPCHLVSFVRTEALLPVHI